MPDISQFIKIYAVFLKDLRSEWRTRFSISSVFLFVLTTITMIAFSTSQELNNIDFSAGIIWVILFFCAMTGLSKCFVSEEERGTSLMLKISSNSSSIYFGKLIFNIFLSISINLFAISFFFLTIKTPPVKAPSILALTLLFGSIGFASSSTIISAIISKANARSGIFAILAFPLLLPLIISCIDCTKGAFSGLPFDMVKSNFQIMFAYSVIVISVSYILFEFVWRE